MQFMRGGLMSESNDPRPVSKVARRTLIAGAAWAVPTVAVLSATPAFAASPPMMVANKNLEKMAGGLRVHVGLNNPLPTKVTATVTVYLTRGTTTTSKTISIAMVGDGGYGSAYVEFPGLVIGANYSGFVSVTATGVRPLTMSPTVPPTMTVTQWG